MTKSACEPPFLFVLVATFSQMFSKHVHLLCFLAMLPSLLAGPTAQRSQVDANVRGNSFGLENFLFHSYENPPDLVRVVKTKRVRPANRAPDRGQTYGVDDVGAQPYESTRLKTTKQTPEIAVRQPPEPTAESNRIKENYVLSPETVIEVTQKPEILETPVKQPERIRKRIMMRRRRKRPSNAAQPESNSEITGNAILKPVRIPIYPQLSKPVTRTKLPDLDLVKTIPTEVTTEEEKTEPAEPQKLTERPVTSTTAATTTQKPSTINLKTFLKQQTETLSLSELLQTQNLSLADLLRGNKDASAILRARLPITSTSPTIRRKQFTREQEKAEQTPRVVETVEVTTSRPNYNGFHPKIPRTKTNEQVPNKPAEEEIPKPVKRPLYGSGSEQQNRLNELRSKLRNFQKKSSTPPPPTETELEKDEAIQPVSAAPKPIETSSYKKNRISFKSSNNPELSLILPNKPKLEQESPKRPERPTNWTNRFPPIKRIGQDRPKPTELPVLNEEGEPEEEPKPTPKIEEEVRKPEQKDELIELLKSGQNADRLQKILDTRNMTIQELLDNREKPPLQTDISSLFAHRQKQTITSTHPTLFDSLPDFSFGDTERPDLETYDEPEAEESVPSVARVQLVPNREAKQFPVQNKGVFYLNPQPDDMPGYASDTEDSSLWKLSEKATYYGSSYGYAEFPAIQQAETTKKTPEPSESDLVLLETIRRSQESNGKFKLDLRDFIREEEEEEEQQPQTEDIERSYIPPAVKSAIIASGVVMGIALFVFIAIFAACGWKQRQIRLKGSSSVLGGTKPEKSKRTLSPVSFKDSHSYKKTIDFDEESSESGASNTSSYLWSTLKNTFTSRASTLKSRLEKEEKMREDKVTLRRNESRRKESRTDDNRQMADEVYAVKKIDRDRNVINTSFNFKRTQTNNDVARFNECVHGY